MPRPRQKNKTERTQQGVQFSPLSLHHISKDMSNARDVAESGLKGRVARPPGNGRALQHHMAKGMNADRGE